MFDRNRHKVVPSKVLHLKGADDELLFDDNRQPMTVTIYGPGSPQAAEAGKRIDDRNLERMMKRAGRGKISADTARADQIERLVGHTIAFSANFTWPEVAGLTGADFAHAVYSDREIGYIADQVQREIGDWANFTSSSATS